MRNARYSNDYIERIFRGSSVFDLWSLLTTLERRVSLPEKSWLFCRLVEWTSATRSGVWTYYEATGETLLLQISSTIRRNPELGEISHYFDRGIKTWRSEQEIREVDNWLDSHEQELHACMMQMAREEQNLIMKLNTECDPTSKAKP